MRPFPDAEHPSGQHAQIGAPKLYWRKQSVSLLYLSNSGMNSLYYQPTASVIVGHSNIVQDLRYDISHQPVKFSDVSALEPLKIRS
jgi:hypothetical protein